MQRVCKAYRVGIQDMLRYSRANKLRTTLQTRSAAERDAIYAPARHGSWHARILYYTIQNYTI